MPSREVMMRRFKTVMKEGNDMEFLYVISVEWVKMWCDFVSTTHGTEPGSIMNDTIYSLSI
jgi:hypothetical protein